MEETPLITGTLVLDQTCISDKNLIQDLTQKGYGDIENDKLFLKSFETLYFLYSDKLILHKGKKQINFDSFMNICQKV